MAFPGGFSHAEAALQFRDVALNASAEVLQRIEGLLLHTHLVITQPNTLVEHRAFDARRSGQRDIGLAGIAAISHHSEGPLLIIVVTRIEYGYIQNLVGRVALLDV